MNENVIRSFLDAAGWSKGKRVTLAGDASNRRYERIHRQGQSVVLMIAPPERGEDVRPFISVAEFLRTNGLAAPEILAADPESGLLLLEDLGDELYARRLQHSPGQENELYAAAIDVLLRLRDVGIPRWARAYDPELMANLAALSCEWYIDDEAAKSAISGDLETILQNSLLAAQTMALRDFHAENLIWRSDRAGLSRVGLIDFQDAMLCHPVYDLVSLLEDARRDLGSGVREQMLHRYQEHSGLAREDLDLAMSVFGAQRNLRILGVFARLCLRDGKPQYIDLIPRVWNHLQRDLRHAHLADLKRIVDEAIPEPSDTVLETLRQECGTRSDKA